MVGAIPDSPGASWLDPCVGDGAFVTALAAAGVPARRITAVDLLPRPSPSDALARTRRGVDFVRWAADAPARFDRVVLNPPYIPLSRLGHNGVRSAALELRFPDGSALSLTANYWCAFLLASLRVIRPGGALCAVLPAAWDFAGYADKVRQSYLQSFARLTVLRSREPLFSSVRDGAIIVVAHTFGGSARRTSRVEVQDAREMAARLHDLPRTSRPGRTTACSPSTRRSQVLRDVADVRIGAVTGDSGYFLLTEDERVTRGLPHAVLRPVLSRARHLHHAFATTSRWRSLRDQGERVWLFHPEESSLTHPAVRDYLALPATRGGCHRDRYKVLDRRAWYRPTLPDRVDGFLSGMTINGPVIVLRRMRTLTATNTLYVLSFKNRLSLEARAAWAIAFLTTPVREELARRARRYADGLTKLEPGDLHDLVLPEPASTAHAIPTLTLATSLFLAGNVQEASALADTWLRRPALPG